jgi:hypothetical protein
VTKFLSVAKLGVCSNRLIPNKIFPIFGSRFRLDSLLDASIFVLSSFFAKRRVRVLRVQVLRRFRRRSPLARLPASSTSLILATLQKTIVANLDMLSNSRSRFCNYQCNWCRTVSKFYANKAIKTFSFEKTSPSPTLSFCMKFVDKLPKLYYSSNTLIRRAFVEIFTNSFKLQVLLSKLTKFVLEFCGLDPRGILALVDIATLSCFNHAFLRIPTRAPCPFAERFFS